VFSSDWRSSHAAPLSVVILTAQQCLKSATIGHPWTIAHINKTALSPCYLVLDGLPRRACHLLTRALHTHAHTHCRLWRWSSQAYYSTGFVTPHSPSAHQSTSCSLLIQSPYTVCYTNVGSGTGVHVFSAEACTPRSLRSSLFTPTRTHSRTHNTTHYAAIQTGTDAACGDVYFVPIQNCDSTNSLLFPECDATWTSSNCINSRTSTPTDSAGRCMPISPLTHSLQICAV
jgi:hypothetical protein